jgi:hypothetical protein
MSAILSDRRARTEVTRRDGDVTLPLIGAARSHSPVTSSDSHEGDWILALIQRAQERVMQQKEAVITLGIDRAQYIRQLQGDGHLSVRRLGLLPEAFWLALVDELRAHFKLDDDSQRLDRALDGLTASVKVIAEIARRGLR